MENKASQQQFLLLLQSSETKQRNSGCTLPRNLQIIKLVSSVGKYLLNKISFYNKHLSDVCCLSDFCYSTKYFLGAEPWTREMCKILQDPGSPHKIYSPGPGG